MFTDRFARITLFGLAACMTLSAPMWGAGARSFPLLPVFGDATVQVSLWQIWLLGGIGVTIIGGLFRPDSRFLLPLIVCLLGMCALDLNRLQPWLWFYVLALSVILAGKSTCHTALRWLLAAVYFWGGANKLGPYFAEDNFQWFCDAFEATRFLGKYPVLGYSSALFEMGLGVLLLWPRTQPWFRWTVLCFHAIIIIFLLKIQWNFVVLPWNAVMAALAFMLLTRPNASVRELPQGQLLLVIFIWLTPLAGLFHFWPYQLSWQLYSNTQPEAVFYSPDPCLKAGEVWPEKSFDDGHRLLLDDWSIASLGVPMFYSDRTFKQMGRYLCTCVPEPDKCRLFILRVHPWDKSAEHTDVMNCSPYASDNLEPMNE